VHRFLYSPTGLLATLVGEAASSFSPILLLFTFAIVATGPTLLLSRMIAPRRTPNPVKFLPMESGQVPQGEGRTHFMMQYYSFVLMFVVFDVASIFLYAWGSSILDLPKSATLPIIAFLAIIFAAFAFALYQAGRKDIW
jgi:NADH-quinone oxidoreductase subunit A